MKKILISTALVAVFALAGWVENGMALTDNGKHNIMSSCQVATGTRTRVSWVTNQAAANACYNRRIAEIRQAEYEQSVIDRNNAEAAYWRDKTKQKNRYYYEKKK